MNESLMFKDLKVMKTNILANMKQYTQHICAVVVLLGMSISAWGETKVTFTPGTDQGTTSVTKGTITCTMTSMDVDDYYQIFADASGTFSCSAGNITKIEITCNESGTTKYGPGNASANVGSYTYSGYVGTWIGEAASVTISTSKQMRITLLEITYEGADPYTVTFNAQGGTFDDDSEFDRTSPSYQIDEDEGGAGITLPHASPSSSCVSEGWGFYGWATAAVGSSTTTAPTIVGKAGDTYYPKSSGITLHAVYYQLTGETSTATFDANTLTGLTKLSTDTKRPAQYIHSASKIELYIKDYGIFSSTWDIDNSINNGNGWGYIKSPSKIQSIAITVSSGYAVDHISESDAGSAALSTSGTSQTITCTGEVYTIYLYAANNGESRMTTFTVTYSTANYYSTPSCCDKAVTVSAGTKTNVSTIAFSETSVPTCGDQASRSVTVTVTTNSGYEMTGDLSFSKSSGTATATKSTGPTGTGPYTYVYYFNQNDNGAGSFDATASAKSYTVTLNDNNGSGGSGSKSVTFNSNTNMTSAVAIPERTHYIFGGYWTSANSGATLDTKIIDTDGTWVASVTGYTDATPNWIKADNVTLYAKWTEHTYTNYRTTCSSTYDITLDKNSGDADGSAKVDADATKLKSISAPTKTGYKVAGYYAESGNTNKVAGADGTLEKSVTISATAWTNGSGEWVKGSGATLYADWTPISYEVRFNKNNEDATGEMDNQEFDYGTDQDLSANTFELTGYTFVGWAETSGGDKAYDDEDEVGDLSTTDGGIVDLYAVWTANKYTLTLANTDATSGSSQTVQATFDDAMPMKTTAVGTPAVAALSRTGYTFTGWSYSGKQYYSYDGSSLSSANNWDVADNKTLTPDWSINSYTLTWSWNGGSTSSTTHTAAGSVVFGTTLAYPDDESMSKTGYTFNGWSSQPSTMPATNTTITAQWTINNYNVAVLANSHVTITATPDGGDAIAESANADVNYNKTVTLNYDELEDGYTWSGWRVTKADDGTAVSVSGSGDGATFDLPDYDVKVSAIIYSEVGIAWCEPEDITITGDVHLTSYKTVPVNTTSGAGNLNISCDDLGSATEVEVVYVNGSSQEVAATSSVFRLCNDGTSNYDVIDGEDLDVSGSRELDQNYSIQYTPNAFGQTDNWQLKLKFKKGSQVLKKTVTHAIHGRALPEEFVIASKKDGVWYALPNTIGTSLEDVTPVKITVNNTTTPTAALYAPSTVVYKGSARYRPANNISSVRLTGTGSNWLTTSSTNGQLSLREGATPEESIENKQVWHLNSTDFGYYTLKMDPSQSPGNKQLGIYNGKMGMFASGNVGTSGQIYLLPITNKYTEIAATVSEWGEHGVIVEPTTPGALTGVNGATMHIDDASPSAATASAVNANMGKAKRVRVYDDGGDLTVGAVANDGKQLYIHWKNGETEVGVSQIEIPTVVAANANVSALTNKTEVHVLPGIVLTGNEDATISTLHLYPGATLNVSTGTFNATTLRLHNGWTRAGTKKYDVARVYIADNAALTKTTASMDYDIYEQTDGRHYYPLAVPFRVAVEDIDYADETLALYSEYGMDGQYVIKTYDGEQRAARGGHDENWIDVPLKDEEEADVYLEPGKGYIITAISVKGEAIIRVPLDYKDAWTADGEKATAHYDDADHTKNVVAVTAWEGDATANGKKLHAGWNLLGVPYMSCYKTGEDMETEAEVLTGKVNFNSDPISFEDDEIKYVSVPVHDFSEYIQVDITDAGTKLLPGWCFFVQIAKDGNLTFLSTEQMASSSLPIYAPKREQENMPTVKTGIILSDGEKSDKTTFLISDKYSATNYEINADLEKMFGNAFTLSTYSMIGNTKFAYNALSTQEAQQAIPLGVRIPADGEYTFSLNPQYAEANIERLDLIDYVASETTNLMTDSYTFTMTQGENTARFALNVTMRQETPTDIETVSGEGLEVSGARKMIINDKLYILREGVMYDATGKKVGEVIRNK